MALHRIRKGLDLLLPGAPDQRIGEGNPVSRVALLGQDGHGLRPDFAVEVGDRVRKGQLLYTDRSRPGIRFTSPGAGSVSAINRGDKRAFISIVIDLDGDAEITFKSRTDAQIASLTQEEAVEQLVESGLWTALRTRPLSKIPVPGSTPAAIFVTAMDTQPLAPSAEVVIKGRETLFKTGLSVLQRLTDGKVFVCKAAGSAIPSIASESVSVEEFAGPHPAGNAGTHIHMLLPAHQHREVWSIGLQDVIAAGMLFSEGRLSTDRIIALAGSEVKAPRLINTRLGASIEDLTEGEFKPGFRRVISGSVFNGHIAAGPAAYLGRPHQQVTVLPDNHARRLFGWLDPGFNLFSVKNMVASKLMRKRSIPLTPEMHGGPRSIVPIGSYEKVMPLDILPTYLLRALAVDDVDEAVKLGALELDEEDLALCTFVCPSKINHGENLRRVLKICEKEVL
jgi:Na+-transporting NADH:ubiquinone oxidoreductase subunit A